jgi:predicted dehydrogenase
MAVLVKSDAKPLRVLQAGFGAFGAVHARAWAGLGGDVRLTIAEPNARAQAQAREAGATDVVSDWGVALGDADVVDIVTPSDTHARMALTALDAGCDVLIEKPMTVSLAEARGLAAKAATDGRIVQVGYVMRVHPVARHLRDRMRSGEIGTPVWITADFISLKTPRRDAGVVLNDAVHVMDLVFWIIGRAPDEVSATLLDRLGRGMEDLASIMLHWRDGPAAHIEASCIVAGEHPDPYAPGGFSRKRLTVTGDRGQIIADFMTDSLVWRPCRHERAEGWWSPVCEAPQTETFAPMAPHESVALELAAFLEAVKSRRQPEADVQSGVAMAAVCDAIFAAARERRTVRVEAT